MFKFKCIECGKFAQSKYEQVDKCQSCRAVKQDIHKCKACDKNFYSTMGKVYCRACFAIRGEYSGNYLKNKTSALRSSMCKDIRLYKKQIYLLATKLKWGYINFIDYFRIADIYMSVTCDENKYSQMSAEEQCALMIADMVRMLDGTIEIGTPGRIGKGVVKVDGRGAVIKEYKSVKDAADDNDLYLSFVRRSCNESEFKGLGKNRTLRFRWKRDINI